MFCLGESYLEFVENYDFYLDLEMQEFKCNKYIDATLGVESFYPKGILGDKVIWYFNHNAYASDAIKKWNERAKRVNMNNVAVIMTLQNDEDAYRFSKLKVDKKLGIYHKDLNLKDVIYCPAWSSGEERLKYNGNWPSAANHYLSNSWGHVSPINWIDFLNGEVDIGAFNKYGDREE